MSKAIFHIGFGKTGTSSIQTALCLNETLNSEGVIYQYKVISSSGEVLSKDAVRASAESNSLGYCSSTPNLADLDCLEELGQEIARLNNNGIVPIFSQEDWARRAGDFTTKDVFEKMNVDAEIVAYVRPQVEWMNSGWWQWFAWNGDFKNVEDVSNNWGLHFLSWHAQLLNWKNMSRVEKVNVRLHCGDVVSDFFKCYLNIDSFKSPAKRSNVSLAPVLIKLLLRYPDLRGEHSAHVDEILSEVYPGYFPNPWVISESYADYLISELRNDNLALLDYLDDESRTKMLNNRSWWDTEAYQSKFSKIGFVKELTELEKDDLIENMIQYILR